MTFSDGDKVRIVGACLAKSGQTGKVVGVRKYGERIILSVAFEDGQKDINGLYVERITPERCKNPKIIKRGKK